MKTIILIAYCLLPLACFGQYSVNTGIQTNRVVTAGATSNYTSSVTIARTRYLAARVSVTTTNTGASGNFYTLWQTSLDNTNWNDSFVITNTVSGTNIVSAQTNHVDIGSHQYLRLARSTNNATHQVTNFYAIVTYKVSVAQDVISAIGYNVQPASTQLTNVSSGNSTLQSISWTNLVNVPTGFSDNLDDTTTSPTNATAFSTTSNPTNQFAIDTLYTNLPQRTLLVGSAVLNSAVAGDANITLFYTNGTAWAVLPMQIGLGIAMADRIPFSVILSPSATFKFVSTFGTGATGHITNTVNWQL